MPQTVRQDKCAFNINNLGLLVLRKEDDIEFLRTEQLTAQQQGLYDKWSKYNELTTDIFRFYAGLSHRGAEWFTLSFEFCYYKDLEGQWDRSRVQQFTDSLKKRYPIEIGMMEHGRDNGRPFERIDVSIDLSDIKMTSGDACKLMSDLDQEFDQQGLRRLLVSVI